MRKTKYNKLEVGNAIGIPFGILLNIFFHVQTGIGQDWGRYWCFGDSAGIDFADVNNPITFQSEMDCSESCASVGDSVNGLLMYAHTDYWPLWIAGYNRTTVVHNKFHQIMFNGDSLVGNAFHSGISILPKPGNDSVFYLFQWGFRPDSGLFYSIIEPYFNNGMGRVTQKNVQLLLSRNHLQGGVITCKHGNGKDWWIIVRNGYAVSNTFNLFLLTSDTLLGPIEQIVGTVTNTDVGMISISKQGDKIVLVNQNGLIETYSFNRCSGIIDNAETFSGVPNRSYFGCEFSPSGNVLYVANTNNIFGNDSLSLYQFDLTQPNPGNTIQVIYQQPVPASGGLLKRGPDDKIYFTCLDRCGWPYFDTCRTVYNENLGVINQPDSLGAACNFAPFSFYLGGKRTYWNLPNNPNYLLGPLAGSSCDSLSTSMASIEEQESFRVFPNPSTGQLYIVRQNPEGMTGRLYQCDLKLVREFWVEGMVSGVDLSGLGNGVYILELDNVRTKVILSR